MRIKNTLRNMSFNFIGQIFSTLLSFVCRTVFIKTLGVEYLGVNGLFSNVLTILSLAELGVGQAIIYSLYRPLADKDEAQISALINLYKRTYTIIGGLITILGLSIIPFMDYIVGDGKYIENLSIIYIMYLLNTVTTYFYASKKSLIIADQKSYVCTIYQNIMAALQCIVLVVILLITKNFLLYTGIQIVFTFLSNYLLAKKADDMYPFIKIDNKSKLNKSEENKIFKNVRAMFMHKIGNVIVNNTDYIIMSSFVGIASVGIYSNYKLILNIVSNIIGQIFNATTASVGNLGAIEDKDKIQDVYEVLNFVAAWIFGFVSIGLMILFNQFIELWIGKQYILPQITIIWIVVNFYMLGMRKVTLMFRDALGLFWYDRYKPIAESVINIIVSLLLVHRFGIVGILVGTFISTICTCFWIEPYVLYKYGFNKPIRSYFIKYIKYTLIIIVLGIITNRLTNLFINNNILAFLMNLAICTIVPNVIFVCITSRSKEFKYLITMLREVIGYNKPSSFFKFISKET